MVTPDKLREWASKCAAAGAVLFQAGAEDQNEEMAQIAQEMYDYARSMDELSKEWTKGEGSSDLDMLSPLLCQSPAESVVDFLLEPRYPPSVFESLNRILDSIEEHDDFGAGVPT